MGCYVSLSGTLGGCGRQEPARDQALDYLLEFHSPDRERDAAAVHRGGGVRPPRQSTALHPSYAIALCLTLALAGLTAACSDGAPVTTVTDTASDAPADAVPEVAAPDIAVPDIAEATAPDAIEDLAADVAGDATQVGGCPGGPGCPCAGDQDCDDGDPCTYGAACEDGACSGGLPENCDDANSCTADTCILPGTCTHTAAASWCEDGDACSLGDTCSGGKCVAGKAAKCDDGNGCTADSCVPGQGCQFAATTAPCADANDCVEASFCALGGCVQGKSKPCDDNKACTYDGCDPKTGCEFIQMPAAASCSDGAVQDGWCFKATQADSTWSEGRKLCQGWGGELATIRNANDNAVARKQADASCGKVSAWIGLSDRAQEGKFVWADGYNGYFGGWNGGEPNNSGDEDVVELVPEGGWNDLGAGAKRGCAVCFRPLASVCDDADACTQPSACAAGACLPAAATVSCDDANPCTLDGCAVSLGCGHTAAEDGGSCGSGLCKSGVCQLAKPVDLAQMPTSCAAIDPAAFNGTYWIDPDGPTGPIAAFQAWCDIAGGGWTLALQVNGAKAEAAYASPFWTEITPTVAPAWPAAVSARMAGYATLPVTAVKIVFVVQGQPRTLILPVAAKSLHALVTGPAVKTTASVVAWQALLPKGSLQGHCLLQGFDVAAPNGVKARIGIFGNNEKDCGSVDSWIGLGATANICGAKDVPTTGNLACWNPDFGDASQSAVGWVLVR